jgi:hypothetical protein
MCLLLFAYSLCSTIFKEYVNVTISITLTDFEKGRTINMQEVRFAIRESRVERATISQQL